MTLLGLEVLIPRDSSLEKTGYARIGGVIDGRREQGTADQFVPLDSLECARS